MTDEMMPAQMAAAYAAQRAELVKQQDNHLQQLLPPDLVSFLQHYMQSREYSARQALSVILYQFSDHAPDHSSWQPCRRP